MTKRTNSFVAAAAAAVALVAAAPASATPTIFEANSAGPAAIGAFEGTVIYTSGDRADQFSLKRSVDGGAPTPFATPLSLKGPVTMDMGPGVGRSIAHPAGTPVVMFRDGSTLKTFSATDGRQLSSWDPSPKPTGDISTFRGRVAYVAGSGTRKRLVVGWRSDDASARVVARGDILNIELGWTYVAYVTRKQSGDRTEIAMHIVNVVGHRDQVIKRAASGAMSSVSFTKPSFTPATDALIWPETRFSSEGQFVLRYDLKAKRLSKAPGKRQVSGSAWAGDKLGLAYSTYDVSTNDCELPCTVGLTGPLTFKAQR